MANKQEIEQRKLELLARLLGQTAAIWTPWRSDHVPVSEHELSQICWIHKEDYQELGIRWQTRLSSDRERKRLTRTRDHLVAEGKILLHTCSPKVSFVKLTPEALAKIRLLCGESLNSAAWEIRQIHDLMVRQGLNAVSEIEMIGDLTADPDEIAFKLVPAIVDGLVGTYSEVKQEIHYWVTAAGRRWLQNREINKQPQGRPRARNAALKKLYLAAFDEFRLQTLGQVKGKKEERANQFEHLCRPNAYTGISEPIKRKHAPETRKRKRIRREPEQMVDDGIREYLKNALTVPGKSMQKSTKKKKRKRRTRKAIYFN